MEPAAVPNNGRAGSRPLRAGRRDKAAQGARPSAGGGPQGAPDVAAPQRRPAQPPEAPQQPAPLPSALGQDQDKEAPRHGRTPLPQQAPPLPPPAGLLSGGQPRPRHGNGTAPIEHAEDQDAKALAQGRRSQGPRPLLPLPPLTPHPSTGAKQVSPWSAWRGGHGWRRLRNTIPAPAGARYGLCAPAPGPKRCCRH